MIFDDKKREDTSPKRNQEGEFAFLNRSDRPEIARVRELIESCVKNYPVNERSELISRIRCGNDIHFRSATFELLLHATLNKLGCALTPHPTLESSSTARPDFLVTTPDGPQFYLEAVLASKNDGSDPGAEARKGLVIDALASSRHDRFMIEIDGKGDPDTQPKSKTLVRDVLQWLDTLDPDDVQRALTDGGFEARPVFKWDHDGWSMTIRPIPLKPERRGKSRSLVGIQSGGVRIIDSWTPIRDAVKKKGQKYRKLRIPLLVAVNLNSFDLNKIDEMQALYGEEQLLDVVGHSERESRFERAPNGAWHGKNGPQYTRVSGMWIFNDLSPYTLAKRRHTVYFNPWALLKLPGFLKLLPNASVSESKIEWVEGVNLRDIFKLNEGWPE